MTCPVYNDTLRYYHNLDKAEARDDFIDGEADKLFSEWKSELDATGIIEDIWMELGDIQLSAQEHNQEHGSRLTPMQYLWQIARDKINEVTP